jgi:hypothetical protein
MRVISSFILLMVAITVATSGFAQETWDQKKAARFQPITDPQQASIAEAVPKQATATPKRPRRILVFYRCEGFIHTSIPHGNLALPSRWIWPIRTMCSRPII